MSEHVQEQSAREELGRSRSGGPSASPQLLPFWRQKKQGADEEAGEADAEKAGSANSRAAEPALLVAGSFSDGVLPDGTGDTGEQPRSYRLRRSGAWCSR